MPNITEEKWIEMLEKKADGTYIAKYPKVKSKSGVTFDEHLEEITAHQNRLIPSGLISMWSGSIADIPEGWALCDGNNGTPDLRNRFIVGAGNEYSVGATGGAKEVTLTKKQMPSHSHNSGTLSTTTSGTHSHKGVYVETDYSQQYSSPANKKSGSFDGIATETITNSVGAHTHSMSGSTTTAGEGQAHENRPPYFALAFIMKL